MSTPDPAPRPAPSVPREVEDRLVAPFVQALRTAMAELAAGRDPLAPPPVPVTPRRGRRTPVS